MLMNLYLCVITLFCKEHNSSPLSSGVGRDHGLPFGGVLTNHAPSALRYKRDGNLEGDK